MVFTHVLQQPPHFFFFFLHAATENGHPKLLHFPTRSCVSLASRASLCINPSVKSLGGGGARINAACLELQVL